MIMKKMLYEPLIKTIPDDTSIFSVLDIKTEIGKKIVMENYINFYAFRDQQYGNIVFRFENFMNYESIFGLERCFVPIDIMKKYYMDCKIIVELLSEGYVMMLPVCKSSISFYKKNPEGMHLLLIYGVDTTKKNFFCKDFSGHKFLDFLSTFDEIRDSLKKYYRPFPKEADGMLAFRINLKATSEVDYAKVYIENYKLKHNFFSRDIGYGVGAINLAIYDAEQRPKEYIFAERFFNLSCYLLEASKLFKFRYEVLKSQLQLQNINFDEDILKKLCRDVTITFAKVEKLHLKKARVKDDVLEDLIRKFYMCRDDFGLIAECFCDCISKIEL